jgi:hypothetical protein
METALTKEVFSNASHSFETYWSCKAMEAQPIVYTPHGVCCSRISYETREGRLFNVRFESGCTGNSKGLARLLEGMAKKA